MTAHIPEPALIIVDVQEGFVTPETKGTVGPILQHLDHRRPRYTRVIATRFVNRPRSLYETERHWSAMMSPPQTRLVRGIGKAADTVITKHGLAPDAGELLPMLQADGIRRVELCGFDTDQCVLATALLLWDAGIAPRILEPLCSSSGGPDMHDRGLVTLRRAIGDRNVTDLHGQPV